MTKASKTRAGRRRSNPLMRDRARSGRPRLNFDGQNITCTLYVNQSQSGNVDGNVGLDWQGVECSSTEGINRPAVDVTKHYQDYRYRSVALEWQPRTGPASTEAPARITVAYIDNPELINQFKDLATSVTSGEPTSALGMCKAVANARSFNAWERFTYRVPLSYRRKWFNTNIAIGSAANNEETDRSIQGLVIIGYETIGTTATAGGLGIWRIASSTEVRAFTATILT